MLNIKIAIKLLSSKDIMQIILQLFQSVNLRLNGKRKVNTAFRFLFKCR